MKPVLVFQHVAHEHLGTLAAQLRGSGFQTDTLSFWRGGEATPSLAGYAGLIVLGGFMGVNDGERYPHLVAETRLIEQAAKNSQPVLGICLGAQLIAHALGARVYPSGIKEIGWYDLSPTAAAKEDRVFRHFGDTEKIFQWHGDTFDLPHGTVHLARSPLCANQAFRYGKNLYALQFHLEVDQTMIDNWLDVPENQREIANLGGQIDPKAIRAGTARHIGRLGQLSRQVFNEFIRLLEP